ncbi:MAG: DMT family transporter [Pseudomonadota bacterium]|nr:DMT family transporter [Pseudomonadota bacterium]
MLTPLAAVGLAVLLHVAWNLLARRSPPEANFLWWIVGLHVLLFAPFTLADFIRAAEQTPQLGLSAAITGIANGVYFVALRRAYALAPASAVYPLARSAPLLIAVLEFVVFDRSFTLLSWGGILIGVAGLWLIATSAREGAARLRQAWPYAALAALMTALYSLSDKAAAPHLPDMASTLGYVCATYAIGWVFLSLEQWRAVRRWTPEKIPGIFPLLVGSLGVGTAYALVIASMRHLPAAYIVTLTNAGIVLTVLLGVLWLKERDGWRQRMAGACLVGVSLLIVGSAVRS